MSSKDFCRPDPDELLRQIQAQEAHASRGRLKVFLGYAPRVGKSERMFDEGRRRLKRGQDVVVGAIQAKGSDELHRMIREFEVIPTLRIERGEAVNVDAILERHPQVCLIDELARDNPPGARFTHRWRDVEELRAHGINVVGAINLQHVCEQQDAVEKITGRRSAHSVPASFVNSADELVIVDVPPEELERESPGPYSLTAEQLSQLRELALLLAAQVVEEQLQRYMDAHGIHQSWGTQERILVCITPRSSARSMLESGARATDRFHGHMLAVYVKQGELSREAEEALQNNLDYARKLGAEVHILDGGDPIDTILHFAREERISQVFIGHTQRASWKFWERNPADRLIQAAEGMDVRLFPHTAAA
jgi:two-component system sensor histidine kinase KdpD